VKTEALASLKPILTQADVCARDLENSDKCMQSGIAYQNKQDLASALICFEKAILLFRILLNPISIKGMYTIVKKKCCRL
jgi:hypothetical protein